MNTKQLKDKILSMAMRGELVEQDPSDESAEILLEKIKEEKAKLIAEKKIKKEKPLAPIEEDEIPYALPQGWVWTRLGEISDNIQYGVNKSAQIEGKYKLLRITDIQNDKVNWESVPFTDIEKEEASKYLLENDDFLFARTGATVGKSYLVKNLFEKSVFASYLIRISLINKQSINYIKFFFNSPFYWQQISNKSQGVGQPNVNGTSLKELKLPLPPLAEQKRIVEKIETLFVEVDKLEESRENLDGLKGKLDKKLLDMAMRGELVEQDSSEESAQVLLEKIKEEKAKLIAEKKIKKEKPLSPIEEDEIPYDLPQGWVWTRLGEYMDVRDGTHDTPKYFETGNPLVTSKNLVNDTIDFEDTKKISDEDCEKINQRSLVEDGDILMAMIGTIGRAIVVPKIEFPYAIKNVALFKKINPIQDTKFIKFYLNCIEDSLKNTASGGNQKFLSLSRLRSLPIPIPPLAEQKRIVERLERVRKVMSDNL